MAVSYWAVVPAAGSGARMGGDMPKQNLNLAGVPVLQRSLDALLAWEELEGVVVALAPGDARWPALSAAQNPRVMITEGGAERSDSVLSGLRRLADRVAEDDWVMVHDAARPCLRLEDLRRLVDSLAADPVGGLLAVPVVETVKRADSQARILETVPREALWLAQTPQLFRYGLLLEALETAQARGAAITDEASAVEETGARPRLIPGDPGNIKITRPEDLPLAERFLASTGS
jgi:2-C-methyl-D-erythritol 4-phosphate cytidylyltransferase